jgi:hypothetical protein
MFAMLVPSVLGFLPHFPFPFLQHEGEIPRQLRAAFQQSAPVGSAGPAVRGEASRLRDVRSGAQANSR